MNIVKTIHVNVPALDSDVLVSRKQILFQVYHKKEIKPLKVIVCKSLLADIMYHSISALL